MLEFWKIKVQPRSKPIFSKSYDTPGNRPTHRFHPEKCRAGELIKVYRTDPTN